MLKIMKNIKVLLIISSIDVYVMLFYVIFQNVHKMVGWKPSYCIMYGLL